MVNAAQAEELVKTGNHTGVLEIREPADSYNKFGAATPLRYLKARLLNISIREPESLAHLAQTDARNQTARLHRMGIHEWAGL